MAKGKARRLPTICVTDDVFVAAVPWGPNSVSLVYRRKHGGRVYIRLRTWNRHKTKDVWYPTKRYYVVPEDAVLDLSAVLFGAFHGDSHPKPKWLAEREAIQERQIAAMDLPEDIAENAIRRARRA